MAESIHYTNRKGKTYYLHPATTKAGKTRYVMTRSAEDALTKLPEGYVITENVNGQVSAGRIKPRLITKLEEARVKSELEKFGLANHRVAVQHTYITIYEPRYHEEYYLPMLEQMAADASVLHMEKEDLIEDFLIAYQEALNEIGFSSRDIARMAAAALAI